MAAELSEKERVYGRLEWAEQELKRVQKKCERLRREVRQVKKNTTARESAALRAEADAYRKALSNIAYRLDNGGVDDETLRHIVESSLVLKGLKIAKRKQIAKVRDSGASTGRRD